MSINIAALFYLISAVLFILCLRGLSHPQTARNGNFLGMAGMALAILTTTVLIPFSFNTLLLIITGLGIGGFLGYRIVHKVEMTKVPQLVAGFHSFVGLAAVLVGVAAFYSPEAFHIGLAGNIHFSALIEMALGILIGGITFSGSVIAFAKLDGRMKGAPITYPNHHLINLALIILAFILIVFLTSIQSGFFIWCIVALSLILGVMLIIPIGGADMPVVVSMLNSYSGWSAAAIGFTLQNIALIITGAIVGSSGAILSYIMCKGMNRSFFSVIAGGFGSETDSSQTEDQEQRTVKQGSADDAAFMLKNAQKVIIVPGYGMAVAGAQHALKDMTEHLSSYDVDVKYAIHPVAGRMPGHMNVLLAEANVSYDDVFELEDINNDFSSADVVFVIGANDITNPLAKTDQTSPIYGMPILEVEKAKTILFVKRSLGSGYAGISNPIFYHQNTMMLFGDAKKMTENIVKAFEER